MTEWPNIAPNPKRRNIKKYKKSVKNKWLCNRLNCEPTSQRGIFDQWLWALRYVFLSVPFLGSSFCARLGNLLAQIRMANITNLI